MRFIPPGIKRIDAFVAQRFTDWRGGPDCCGYIDREDEDEFWALRYGDH